MTALLPQLEAGAEQLRADEVDRVLAAARYELAVLEDAVGRAEQEAEELEQLAAGRVAAGDPSATERVVRFLDLAATELAARRRATIDAARAEASARVAAAEEDADRIRSEIPHPEAPAEARPTLALLAPEGEAVETSRPFVVDLRSTVPMAAPHDPGPGAPPATPVEVAALDELDLTDLTNLLPLLEAVAAPAPPAEADVDPGALGGVSAIGSSSEMPTDDDEPFETFWRAPEPEEPPAASRSGVGYALVLLPMVIVLALVAGVLLLIG